YGQDMIGGLVGSSNSGHITGSYSLATVSGDDQIGGLAGHINDGTIELSYATGNVTGDIEVGGLVGKQLNSAITYSYATGHVVGCEDTGGLVGDSAYLVANSFATGQVTYYCSSGYGDSIGGLVGDGSDGTI